MLPRCCTSDPATFANLRPGCAAIRALCESYRHPQSAHGDPLPPLASRLGVRSPTRDAWKRCQKVWRSKVDLIVLGSCLEDLQVHPPGPCDACVIGCDDGELLRAAGRLSAAGAAIYAATSATESIAAAVVRFCETGRAALNGCGSGSAEMVRTD